MRILLLLIQFPPDGNPSGRLMSRVAEGLLEYGHAVSVITAFPHYEKFKIWPEYRGKLAQRAVYKGMDVLRLWVYASGAKQRMQHRLLSYLSFNTLAAATGLVSRRSYDVILCPNGSFFTGIAASIIGRPRGIPFVYNVQDLYPEVPVHAGQLRNKHAISALETIERTMYRLSAHITVIAPSFRDNLIGKGVAPQKVSLIPNFVETDVIRPLPKENPFSRRMGLVEAFVVSYAGNLGYVYDLGTLIEAAALLAAHKDLIFLIVGEGVAKADLERQAQALNLRNVRFLPFQPAEDLPWLRATSDIQVSLHRPGTTGYSMPSKIYEIMASGRPLLASADVGSDVWQVVQTSGCGVCIEPGDATNLAQTILMLQRNPELRLSMSQHGRQYAEQSFSRQSVVERYHDLLQQITAPSSRSHHMPSTSA